MSKRPRDIGRKYFSGSKKRAIAKAKKAKEEKVLRLVAVSLFTIFISTCTLINFKLIVSKNENKYKYKKKKRRKVRWTNLLDL